MIVLSLTTVTAPGNSLLARVDEVPGEDQEMRSDVRGGATRLSSATATSGISLVRTLGTR
jgi:hypothetical protein